MQRTKKGLNLERGVTVGKGHSACPPPLFWMSPSGAKGLNTLQLAVQCECTKIQWSSDPIFGYYPAQLSSDRKLFVWTSRAILCGALGIQSHACIAWEIDPCILCALATVISFQYIFLFENIKNLSWNSLWIY